MEPVLPSVYAIDLGYVYSYLVDTGPELVLIDAGLMGNERKILGGLSSIGRKVNDIKHILVTHHHSDHVGSLRALRDASGARVYVHPLDAPIVAGEKKRPGANPRSIAGVVLGPVITRLPMYNPPTVRADEEVVDGQHLAIGEGFTVYHAPGHTAGSVAYLMHAHGGVLFGGDVAGRLMGRLDLPLRMFTEDMKQAKRSLQRLATLEFDTLCFGHGRAMRGRANVKLRKYIEKRTRKSQVQPQEGSAP
jgi:glyoxylase-like metal-dependent hydrolase (beta-lactamase superfamily II)